MEINECSTQDLIEELKTRKKNKDIARPKLVSNEKIIERTINFKSYMECLLNDIEKRSFNREDEPTYLYEAVMEIYYGDEIWKWINSFN